MPAVRWLAGAIVLAGCAAAPAPSLHGDGSRLVWIEPGRFLMGNDDVRGEEQQDEPPVHEVRLTRRYAIGEREVTWGQFRRFCAATGRAPPEPAFPVTDDHPVHHVTWHDARAYCAWAGLRLPTEAEWERAAAGPTRRRYPWGDEPAPGRANWLGLDDGHETTAPAGALAGDRSPDGCLDMSGNVREWVADRHGPYPAGPVDDPSGPVGGDLRVARGGAWSNEPGFGRTTNRKRLDPGFSHPAVGFRVAR